MIREGSLQAHAALLSLVCMGACSFGGSGSHELPRGPGDATTDGGAGDEGGTEASTGPDATLDATSPDASAPDVGFDAGADVDGADAEAGRVRDAGYDGPWCTLFGAPATYEKRPGEEDFIVIATDVNGDGKSDLVATSYDYVRFSVAVFLGVGDGTF